MWQMEICKQRLNYAEFKSRRYEDVCAAGVGNEFTLQGTVFQRSDSRRSCGGDAAPLSKRSVELLCCFGWQSVAFGVEMDVFDSFDAHRLKCSQADVQRDVGNADTAGADLAENLRREVQTGGGSGDGTSLAREYGLVALAIGVRILAVDIGRQRDVANCFNCCEKVRHGLEAKRTLAELVVRCDFGTEFVFASWCFKEQDFSSQDLSAGAHKGGPLPVALLFGQEDLNAAGWRFPELFLCLSVAFFATGEEPGWDNTAVVQNEQVAFAKKCWEIVEVPVRILARYSIKREHAPARALRRWLLRD